MIIKKLSNEYYDAIVELGGEVGFTDLEDCHCDEYKKGLQDDTEIIRQLQAENAKLKDTIEVISQKEIGIYTDFETEHIIWLARLTIKAIQENIE